MMLWSMDGMMLWSTGVMMLWSTGVQEYGCNDAQESWCTDTLAKPAFPVAQASPTYVMCDPAGHVSDLRRQYSCCKSLW